MTEWHGGKGDRRRPLAVPREVYDDNWTRIFGDKHRKAQELAAAQREALRDECRAAGLTEEEIDDVIEERFG